MLKIKLLRGLPAATVSVGLIATAIPALADVGHNTVRQIGEPAKPDEAVRTITVDMYDNYYEPKSITVKKGETLRFVVRNVGAFVHEFSIATAEMHKAHRPEMMSMMESGMLEPDRINHMAGDMKGGKMHDDPNSILLEPGKDGEIVWRFPEHAKLEFACNIPGHYESGMVGKFTLNR